MFKKLRNKLIAINVGITTAVLIIAFSIIYIFYTNSSNNRPPVIREINLTRFEDGSALPNDNIEQIVIDSLRIEKTAAANQLLIMLIVSGIAIDLVVVAISYYLAEQAIKPVKEAYESQKIFIANASHEIKTPLAAISANLEAADIKNNKWIDNVEKETAKLSTLNTSLLTLAKTDLTPAPVSENVNLLELTTKLLTSYEPRLKNISLKPEINSSRPIKLSSTDYVQIFNILLDNAIKYCDKTIIVSLDEHQLVISNDGATINSKDLKHIFDRFYQADKSSEGVGLGLSIAKSIADRNEWTLFANSKKHLTSFTLKF